ncbi:MAG: ABC transporter, ATP-binding protein [uncultured Thermomicrobiales bacterium]|uniref:ABC transporter, ATP-binding protein n=1 Tax=uncultured Thermomicrobiales bacterium TaxID=1645740 RepID=A0A6J4U9R5_9BACT|nr:MAG: ABC transporter, ATP-binding protein [uncultured Thermomicrobiales bacterium]
MAILLQEVRLRDPGVARVAYPFSVPVVRALAAAPLVFDRPVTFLIGENGSGKSTLLEAIACAAGSITVGTQPVGTDPSLAAARSLATVLQLAWSRRIGRGFFMRAEDFFGFVRAMEQLNHENVAAKAAVARGDRGEPAVPDPTDRPWLGGDGWDERSHGEAFLDFFAARVRPGGLYILDEPEAPLSPVRQLALLAQVRDAAAAGAQFLVATHSPILSAVPGARILSLDGGAVRPVAWEDLDHVRLTRQFLNDPDAFLRHL